MSYAKYAYRLYSTSAIIYLFYADTIRQSSRRLLEKWHSGDQTGLAWAVHGVAYKAH